MLPSSFASQKRIRNSTSGRIFLARALAVLQILWLLHRPSFAQEGFVSLDCGGSRSFVSPGTGIAWQPDSTFIFTGVPAQANGSAPLPPDLATELRQARYFPKGISPRKNCYTFTVVQGNAYLVRAGFFHIGNFDAASNSSLIRFEVFLDSTLWLDLTFTGKSNTSTGAVYYEAFTAPASAPTLSVCLIRTYDTDTPFINSLELRLFGNRGYTNRYNASQQSNLLLLSRFNFGETNATSLRYPDDAYDRIWPSFTPITATPISAPAGQQLNGSIILAKVPNRVMQTAVIHPEVITYSRSIPTNSYVYGNTYWAELNNTVRQTERRIFFLASNFINPGYKVDLTPPGGTPIFSTDGYGYVRLSTGGNGRFTITATRAETWGATAGPILNADELYLVQPIVDNTNAEDRSALGDIKNRYKFLHWVGDPCQPISWEELTCTKTESGVRVTSLNLSGKNLSGTIPASIGNLTYLTSLDLSNNSLTGSLDSGLGNLPLKYLDVSNNLLDGTIPSTLLSRSDLITFKYFGNVHLECLRVGNVSCPTGGPSPSASDITERKEGLPILPITGGAAGAILIAIIAGVICWWTRKRKWKEDYHTISNGAMRNPNPNVKQKAQPYRLAMVKEATNNFATQIGKGGFGIVYHGVINRDQTQVELAVKVLKSHQAHIEFYNEIDLLSTVHHKNLVSLVGYCHETKDHLILLYEYMSGGNVQERLYGERSIPPLSWKERLHIALGAARGLEYLHQACKPMIIHRDVKSSNILLSGNLEAKVADFGLSKLTPEGADHISTLVKGTLGYLDPEYNTTGVLTDKSDVYSFGVVLLEVLCSQRPITEEGHIISRVRSAMNEGKLDELVDQAGAGAYSQSAAWKLAQVALNCVQHSSSKRPDMNRVVNELSHVLHIEFGPPPELQGTWTDQSADFHMNPFVYNSTESRSCTSSGTNSIQVEESLSGPR